MALKLRPIGLGSGIDKDRPDYTVFTGEWEVGRIYETRGGPDSLRWFWPMTVNGRTSDQLVSLEGVGEAGRERRVAHRQGHQSPHPRLLLSRGGCLASQT